MSLRGFISWVGEVVGAFVCCDGAEDVADSIGHGIDGATGGVAQPVFQLGEQLFDNLGSHRSKAVRRIIRSMGAKLFFLPKYSPDLNPIDDDDVVRTQCWQQDFLEVEPKAFAIDRGR